MKNLMYKSVLSAVILSSIACNILVVLPNTIVSAEKNPSASLLSWTKIFTLFTNKPPVEGRQGGSRSDDLYPFCLISPQEPDTPLQPRVVWSDRPLFVWRGRINKIAVVQNSTKMTLWSQTVNQTQHQIYTGKPLQPGQIYKWLAFAGDSLKEPSTSTEFQIMDSPERDRITTKLQVLEDQLKAKHRDSEGIALAKAQYFAGLNLWSDVLQQVYTVQKPSPELVKVVQKIPSHLCN